MLTTVLLLLVLFQIKHLVIDFLYQPPWMYRNKGTLWHPGGLAHAMLHGIGTFCVFGFVLQCSAWLAFLAFADSVIHYFVDWSKMNLNRKMGWGPTTSENFWRFLGVDQFAHQLTYAGLIWQAVS